jgi:hypothetical protein
MRDVDNTGIEVIDRGACLDLLAADQIGRPGVVEGGHPLILPVNYGLDGDSIVFERRLGRSSTPPGGRRHASRSTDSTARLTAAGVWWSEADWRRSRHSTDQSSSGSTPCPSPGSRVNARTYFGSSPR